MPKKVPEILDLNKLIENKRVIKLGDKEIDVSKIPAKVTLKAADVYEQLDENNNDSLNMLLDIVMAVVKPQNPEVTKDWIVENVDLNQLIAMVEFIMKPLTDKVGATDLKNLKAALGK